MTGPETVGALERLRGRSLVLGLLGLAACAIGLLAVPGQFFRSWLFGFLFWLGVALGCLSMMRSAVSDSVLFHQPPSRDSRSSGSRPTRIGSASPFQTTDRSHRDEAEEMFSYGLLTARSKNRLSVRLHRLWTSAQSSVLREFHSFELLRLSQHCGSSNE